MWLYSPPEILRQSAQWQSACVVLVWFGFRCVKGRGRVADGHGWLARVLDLHLAAEATTGRHFDWSIDWLFGIFSVTKSIDVYEDESRAINRTRWNTRDLADLSYRDPSIDTSSPAVAPTLLQVPRMIRVPEASRFWRWRYRLLPISFGLQYVSSPSMNFMGPGIAEACGADAGGI